MTGLCLLGHPTTAPGQEPGVRKEASKHRDLGGGSWEKFDLFISSFIHSFILITLSPSDVLGSGSTLMNQQGLFFAPELPGPDGGDR